jgi:large subunit ribosomal protein L18
MRIQDKQHLAQLRRWRVRKKVSGTKDCPRMAVRFTGEHIYVQFVDDIAGATLASTSTRHKATPDREKIGANVAGAKVIGKLAAETAMAKGIKAVVFDRGGQRYHQSEGKDGKPVHGKLAALAEAAREAGLKF